MGDRVTGILPADFGKPSVERTAPAATRHFNAKDKETSETLVVHFKVLTEDPNEALEVARLVRAQLHEQRIGSKDVTWIITGEGQVESAVVNLQPLIAQITAQVKNALGVR